MQPVRSDLVLVRHHDQPYERSFIIHDRATNRYWNTGPVQYEMARIFAKHEEWESACRELREQFEEPLTDEEINEAYEGFRSLGLLELTEDTVSVLPIRTYLRALKLGGVREHEMLDRYGSPAELLEPARLTADEKLLAGFHRALHIERTVKENAHLPAVLRWMRVQVPLFDPSRQLDRWLPRLGFLFRPWFFVLTLLAVGGGLSTYLDHARQAHLLLSTVSGNLALLFGCTVFMLVVHEYAHALACRHFGGEVREMGIIVFLFFIPAAYCDVSDAHLFAGKRAKLWVTFAGTWSTLVLASIGALLWRYTVPTATINHIGLVLMASGYATVLTNLNPLLPLDGYFFLGDWLGVDNLRDRAPDFCKAYLAALLTGKPRPQESPRLKRIYCAYFLLGSTYQIFYLLLSVGFGWLILVRGGTLLGLVIYVLLVYLFYVRTYLLRVRALWDEARTKLLFGYLCGFALCASLLAFVPLPVTVNMSGVAQGHLVEVEVPQRYVEDVRRVWTAEAFVDGRTVALENVHVISRASKGGPILQGTLVDDRAHEAGDIARVTIRSHRQTSLWRKLWGEQWDRVILDVWRLL